MLRSAVFVLITLLLSRVAGKNEHPIGLRCLGCLCEALTSCFVPETCTPGSECGPFRMTKSYWIDAGSPTFGNNSLSKTAFTNCARDFFCSVLTVQSYTRNFSQDCNGDGKIDCDDFAAIHLHGGDNCRKAIDLDSSFAKRFRECISRGRVTVLKAETNN